MACTWPVVLSRTVNTPALSSVATISNAGLRARAALAQSISRAPGCRSQALKSAIAPVTRSVQRRVFMGES
jgi:hypothetical protein